MKNGVSLMDERKSTTLREGLSQRKIAEMGVKLERYGC